MTMTAPAVPTRERVATRRTVLMCRPEHFTVSYRINPWMHPERPTDPARALRQWEELHALYRALGVEVELIDPIPGLPDMVYAANGGFVLDGTAYGARFRHAERAPEGPAYLERLRRLGFDAVEPASVNEGEGDFLLVGETILAGTGFRSDPASHEELRRLFSGGSRGGGRSAVGREVVTLRLVDPSFYHLDTALTVLDPAGGPDAIAYLPRAFDAASRAVLEERYPEAILVSDADAAVLGLNGFSDGRNVVIAAAAAGFARQLRERGFVPHPVDLSELLRGGGGVKCCTLELRG